MMSLDKLNKTNKSDVVSIQTLSETIQYRIFVKLLSLGLTGLYRKNSLAFTGPTIFWLDFLTLLIFSLKTKRQGEYKKLKLNQIRKVRSRSK